MQHVKGNVYLKHKITVFDRRFVFVLANMASENNWFRSIFYLKLMIATLTNIKKPKIWHLLQLNAILKAAQFQDNPETQDEIEIDGDPIELLDEMLTKVAVKIHGMTQDRLMKECTSDDLRALYNQALTESELNRLDLEETMIKANLVANIKKDDRIAHLEKLFDSRVTLQKKKAYKRKPKVINEKTEDEKDNVYYFRFNQ